MFWWLLATFASAGNIYIDASTPILARIQGEKLVKKEPSTRIVIPDLAESTYVVEITDLFGKVIAFKEVSVGWDQNVNLTYEDGYLDVVAEAADLVYADRGGLPLLPHANFAKLERKLVKGSVSKKLKMLDKYTVGYGLTMKQTDEVLSAFHTREDRLAALYQIVDICTEPTKYAVLNHHFAVTSDRDKMTALFEAVLAAGE